MPSASAADAAQGAGVDTGLRSSPVRAPGLALGLVGASGFAALGYQIVWTQQASTWLGHESAAVLAVVAALFGGLALGSWLVGDRTQRSAHPVGWYVACELVCGLWSLVLALLQGPVGRWLLTQIGERPSPVWQWTVAFGGLLVMLLPATVAMGGALPAMERMLGLATRASMRAALYASNTLGAVGGVLAAAFWLVPSFGLTMTAACCAALNGLCALLALRLGSMAGRAVAPAAPERPRLRAHLALQLAATGLLGIGYEVLMVRALGQLTESTIYTFAILLAVYLVGTAIGAAAYQRWLSRQPADDWDRTRGRLLTALAIACTAGASTLWAAASGRPAGLNRADSMHAALAHEVLLALAAFALPTLMMGALFSHLAGRAYRIGFGQALAINTLGAALAPPLFGVLLVPAFGPKFALAAVVLGYLLLAAQRRAGPWILIVSAVGVALAAPPLVLVDLPEGAQLLSHREGALAAVSIVQRADGVSTLHIDNHQQEGSSATQRADGRQALLPLLLHPDPRRVLFLGLGTGVTASTALLDPLVAVEAVELVPQVIDASRHFVPQPDGGGTSRLNLQAADARRFVRATRSSYDVIVSDNFHPARRGSAALYTVEHFQAVRERLAAGGLFCQWVPLHQLDLDTLRSIVASFRVAFPQAQAVLATHSLQTPVLGLLGHVGSPAYDPAALRARLQRFAPADTPAAYGLADELAVLGSLVAGPPALAALAAPAALNTDDHPIVAYHAPRITYAPDSRPQDRLFELLSQLSIAPADVLPADATADSRARLAAYWKARDRFLAAGRHVRPSGDPQAMLAQVGAPLIDVLRISPDFRPALEPLQRLAVALAAADPQAAGDLLAALRQTGAVLTGPSGPLAAGPSGPLVAGRTAR